MSKGGHIRDLIERLQIEITSMKESRVVQYNQPTASTRVANRSPVRPQRMTPMRAAALSHHPPSHWRPPWLFPLRLRLLRLAPLTPPPWPRTGGPLTPPISCPGETNHLTCLAATLSTVSTFSLPNLPFHLVVVNDDDSNIIIYLLCDVSRS
jgi:hypothetical protein